MNYSIYSMFDDFSQGFKKKWGRVFHNGLDSIETALRNVAKRHGCNVVLSGGDYLLVNREEEAEALFRFIPDPSDMLLFQDVYEQITITNVPLAFVVVHQLADGEGNYDIFRISERSFLEHNNRARYRGRLVLPPN